MEELQAKVITIDYLFSLPNTYEYSGLSTPTLDLFFACQLEDYTQLKAMDDVEACFFVPINELNPELFGLNSIRKAIKIFIKNNGFQS